MKEIYIPEPLLQDIAEGRCLPFVGAGFSLNAQLPAGLKMPDWDTLTAILASHAGAAPNASPPAVAQAYEQRFGRVQLIEQIRRALHPDKVKPGAAHLAFADLPFETVYTTNFDLLLEDAYAAQDRPFRSLVGELQMPFHAGREASSIIKMHGDLRHEEHVVVTSKDYENYMKNYPVISTHLSAMLITRTPLFIGYSLRDPDFENIRKIVQDRLGDFVRMSYVIQFNQSKEDLARAFRARLHTISLSTGNGKTHGDALADWFRAVLQRLDLRAGRNIRVAHPEAFEDLDAATLEQGVKSNILHTVLEATSKLCYVSMPATPEFEAIFRNVIQPAVSECGLEAVRAADVVSNAGTALEQVRAAIQQSRIFIADITERNPAVLYDLGTAQALEKPTILLTADPPPGLTTLKRVRLIQYSRRRDGLHASRELLLKHLQLTLSSDRLAEARALHEIGHERAAISSASVVLEHVLLRLLHREAVMDENRSSLNHLVLLAAEHGLIDPYTLSQLHTVVKLRNQAVHAGKEPTSSESEFVIATIERFVAQHPIPN